MEHDSIQDGWTVGPASRRARRGGAIVALVALAAGFAGGLGAGFALDDGPGDGGVLAAVGAPDSASDDGGRSFGPATTAVASGGGFSTESSSAGPMQRTRVFRRDVAGGMSVRVFRDDFGDNGGHRCSAGDWCPPPECFPTASIEAVVVGEWNVIYGGAPWYPLADGAHARLLGVVTHWAGQDDPAFGAIVRTSDAVRTVRLSTDGITDEMTPVDGVAVVVVPSTGFDGSSDMGLRTDLVLEVVDAAGAASQLDLTFASEPDPACIPPPPPPPALPAPGEQPADVAAADAAVRERFASVFGGDAADNLDEGVDDPTGLSEIRDRLREKYPTQSEPGSTSYEVADLVFTSPESAVYQFRPIVMGNPLPWQLGGAVLIDGDWKITRGTACAMYRLGGPSC